MIVRTRLPRFLLWALCTFMAIPLASRADTALVIGINQYPHLHDGDLEGCTNDAASMAAALRKRGFEVVTMTNDQATRENILDRLAQLQSTIKPDERFLFYFAGHGAHNANLQCFLLAADAEENNFDHTLRREELSSAIRKISAKSRTIVLDACYSEGIVRSKGLRFRSRFHRIGPSSKRLQNEGQADGNDGIVPAEACGFTACARNQPAGEHLFDGSPHGVFTYYLVKRLNQVKMEAWRDAVSAVSADVAKDMDGQQTPVFGPTDYWKFRVFDAEDNPSPAPPKPVRTLWEDYVDNRLDPNFLSLSLEPQDSVVKVGTRFKVIVEVGAEGYLVILNKDAKGRIYLYYPDDENNPTLDAKLMAAHVRASPPKAFKTRALSPGTERMKAILFHDKQSARDLISKIPADGLSVDEMQKRSRRLKFEGQDKDWDYYTAMQQIDVEPDNGQRSSRKIAQPMPAKKARKK